MSVTINITGELILDQTAGLQNDDVDVSVVGGALAGGLDADFLAFLNTLGLSTQQKNFAAGVEGASDPNLVTVTATAGETIGKLFFSDATGNDFDGDQVFISPGVPLQTINNQSIYLWSDMNGKAVLAKTAGGEVVAAFYIEGGNGNTTSIVQSITFKALKHPDSNDPDDRVDFSDILRVAAVITTPVGDNVGVDDDGPIITAAFDADPIAAGLQTPEKLGNAVGQTASGVFGYTIGSDNHDAAFYTAGGSDFVDTNGALAGVQINLTGAVANPQNPNITNAVVTLVSEDVDDASFSFSFHYDKDPITAGVQDATAGGTLAFDKAADTYAFTLTDVIDGFSFDVLHTSELLSKEPVSNTGHPNIVVSRVAADNPNTAADEDFFVQFTADVPAFGFTANGQPPLGTADTSFNDGGDTHDLVAGTAGWVSATQATNGVEGDTIQKNESLTLRFFNSNVGIAVEASDPTTTAAGVVLKFDGIGSSEDLLMILDLKDSNGNEITRAVSVSNADIYKTGQIPAQFSSEFSLDNNDGLVIIEQNDYNAAGETYQIQGVQILQSGNGLSGSAIDLNRAVGANGGSSTTVGLQAFEAQDNDVLKIVDIGFVQNTSGTLNADLDFSFRIADADSDVTALQHILVNVSNGWIV